jgi:capsid assembly protease
MPPEAFGEEFDIFFFGSEPDAAFDVVGKYAVVTVKGPLEQAKSWRFDSYAAIKERLQAAFDSESPEVAIRMSSPGGSFAGCLELAREIRAMATAAKKPYRAFVDSQALSAGFALICNADEIVITPSASVGSVGVWSALVDVTAQDTALGRKVEIVASDENKADRNPHVPMTADAIERLRAEVTDMAEMFREEVAEGRGMRPSSLRKLKGAAIFGAAAVKAKLADRLVDSWEEFLGSEASAKQSNNEDEMTIYSLAAMQAAAAKGDKDAAAMLALLAKAEEPDGDEEMKSCGDCGKKHAKKAKCKAEDKEEYAKAKAKEDAPIKKGDEKDEKDAKALALDAIGLVHKMQADAEARGALAADTEERAKLLATRPDFSDSTLALLNAKAEGGAFKLSLDDVKKAVADFPKSTFRNPNTNALQAHGIAGREAGDLHMTLDADTMAVLDRKMPLGGARGPVAFSVGCGDPAAARAFLAAQEAARKAG